MALARMHKRRRSAPPHKSRRWLWLGGAMLALSAAAAGGVLYFLDDQGITPRSLGPYIERRSNGHNAVIEGIGQTVRKLLLHADRGDPPLRRVEWASSIGVQAAGSPDAGPAGGQEVLVSTTPELVRAVAAALPGQVITLLPGRYQVGQRVTAVKPGTADAPITVRARQPGSVHLIIDAGEGFNIQAPYWRFENLSLQGDCRKSTYCEHAFHVVGGAHHFAAVNNTIVDFDAHIKINGQNGNFPDHGLIASNTLRNNAIRMTTKPVTPIDLVAASHWIIRRNLISDFIKGDSDRISYGAFAKGAGSNNVLEQNIVICEDKLRGAPGLRIGLSLGGGGTGKSYCRDGRCLTEQTGSVLRANLVSSCSDDGIYLNAAAQSKLVHNTLVDTGGITVRFPESSADIEGNLVDGIIRSRDGGMLRLADNRHVSAARLYLGSHPQRAWFRDPLALDFHWSASPGQRVAVSEAVPDLCGTSRPAQPRYGAFEDFAACLVKR